VVLTAGVGVGCGVVGVVLVGDVLAFPVVDALGVGEVDITFAGVGLTQVGPWAGVFRTGAAGFPWTTSFGTVWTLVEFPFRLARCGQRQSEPTTIIPRSRIPTVIEVKNSAERFPLPGSTSSESRAAVSSSAVCADSSSVSEMPRARESLITKARSATA
jgi:hypothetical protein